MCSGRVVELLSLTPSVNTVSGSSPDRPLLSGLLSGRAAFHRACPNVVAGSIPAPGNFCDSSSNARATGLRAGCTEPKAGDVRVPMTLLDANVGGSNPPCCARGSSSLVEHRRVKNAEGSAVQFPPSAFLWPSSPSNGGQSLAYDKAEPLGIEAVAVDTGGSCGPRGGSRPPSAIFCERSSNGRTPRLRFLEVAGSNPVARAILSIDKIHPVLNLRVRDNNFKLNLRKKECQENSIK